MAVPTVSVVIPTYRHAELVEETLATVFAQTFSDYEVVVVNDGSPDDTAARLRPLADAGRINYFEQPNAGQGAARNRGLAESRGEFIAFLDDDDLWPPDKLEWQVHALRENPTWVMVSGPAGLLELDGRRTEPTVQDGSVTMQSLEAMFAGHGINSPGQVLIRRTALDAVGGFDRDLWGVDDADLWIRLAAHGPAAQIARIALFYRLHATNASNNAPRMFWNSIRMMRKNLPLLPAVRRESVWREALLQLYVYSGTRIIKAARTAGPRAWPDAARVLCCLLPTLGRDRALAGLVVSDLAPGLLRRNGAAQQTPGSPTRPAPSTPDSYPKPASQLAPGDLPYSVSVIICTRDRAESLRDTLTAIAACTVPPDITAELIIVDNGSRDDTACVARKGALRGALARVIHEPHPGLSRARNAGLKAAASTIILFTDDDVRPPADWIERMCRPILDARADAVAGGVHLPADYEPLVATRNWQGRRGWLASSENVDPVNPGTLIGANMAFRRDIALALGGFDPSLGAGALGFCEETLFAERLIAAGYTIGGALHASVEHHFDTTRLTRATLLTMADRMGRSNAYVDYHRGHGEPDVARKKIMRAWVLLAFERVLNTFRRLHGRESWSDIQRVQTLAYWEGLAAHAGQPRRYAP